MTLRAKGKPVEGSAGYQQITVSNAAKGLTVPEDAYMALINVEDGATAPSDPSKALRYKLNTESPTSSAGMPLGIDDYVFLDTIGQLKNFEAIRASDQDVILNVTYYYGH